MLQESGRARGRAAVLILTRAALAVDHARDRLSSLFQIIRKNPATPVGIRYANAIMKTP